ncbi:sulfotransferase family 2 domain-containing protein [Roseovarius ramblicola]|uniref:Sulfotransferase family 2 domain-containing protein n=1 Tax=Roseovarius ramblicola TaxID=2022336 RepID=A0ABV5I1W0_9RHOB
MLKRYLKRKVTEDGVNSLANAVYGMMRPAPAHRLFSKSPDMVFIWIPKTAGSSVFSFLNAGLGMRKLKTVNHAMSFRNRGSVTFDHIHYLSLLKSGIVSGDYHDRAFKFSFVRNPYARVASLYNYSTRRELLDGEGFDRFLDRVFLRPPVGMYNRAGLSQTNPQTDWLMGEAGDLLADRIFRVEALDEFSRYFQDTYDLTFDASERHNASTPVITVDDILGDAERTEKVNAIYARDFDLLGYEKVVPQ